MPVSFCISIGNELLNGKTTNSNAAHIGRELFQIGLPIERAVTISDRPAEIKAALLQAESKFDTTVITGGLGPTADDLTRATIAEYFEAPLEFHEDIFRDIETRFRRTGQSLPVSNKVQAMIPRGAGSLANTLGTAPGIHIEKNGKNFFFLPGVPAEMKAMLAGQVLPWIVNHYQLKLPEVRLYRTTGIAESRLSDRCQKIFDRFPQLEIAYLPRFTGVDIRVAYTGEEKPSPLQQLEEALKYEVGKYVFEEGERNLETVLGDMLTRQALTIATAESCTGGQIASRLTDVPGSSNYFLGGFVTYSNESKMQQLSVREETLREFGAVSEAVAAQMAEGARRNLQADLGLSTTGIAGPGGATVDKPVGLVYIGLATRKTTLVKRFVFGKDRILNKTWSAQAALELCRRTLL